MDEMEDIPLQEPNDILLNEYGVNDNNQQDAGPRPQDEETGNAELAGSAHTSTTKSQHLKFRINAIYLSLCNFAQESKQQISSHVRDIREKVLLATSSGGRAARSQLSKMKRKAVEARLVEDLVHSSTLFSSLVVVATSKWAEIGEEDNRTSKEEKRAEAWKWMFIASYIVWGFSISGSLYFDWNNSDHRVINVVSHIAFCSIVLYFFASVLSIKTPTTVLPICINLGLLLNAGMQRLSPDVSDRVFGWIGSCLGMPYQRRGRGDAQ